LSEQRRWNRRQTGIMVVSALVVFLLALRALGTAASNPSMDEFRRTGRRFSSIAV